MKRKLIAFAAVALFAIAALLVRNSNNRATRAPSTPSSPLIVTQDGNVTLVSPEAYANFVVVAKLKTNTGASTNNVPGPASK